MLVITATHGFRHERAIATAKELLPALGAVTEFDFTLSENLTDLERLAGFDVLFFANSTLRVAPENEPGLNAAQRSAILEFIRAGGGFVGAHSALDACYGWPAYRSLVGGGLFHSHPWNQTVRITNEGNRHPITAHLAGQFELRDEIYLLDEPLGTDAQVLLSLDMDSVDVERMPPAMIRPGFPLSWTRTEGAGRVFMTKLGHFSHVWLDAGYLEHLLQGLRYAAGHLPETTSQGADS